VDRPRRLDHQAAYADHAAIYFDPVEFLDLFGQSLHRLALTGNQIVVSLTACLPASLIIASPSLGLRQRSRSQNGSGESHESVDALS
jgi:hypothetical protein